MLLKCVNKQSIPLRSVFQRNIKTSSIQFCDHEKQGQDEKSDKKLDVEEISKKEKNLYEHLEIDPSASTKEIKEAYFKLSKIYHPDANPDNPDAQATFFEITRAYETLSDGKLRRIYDKGDLGRAISAADRELIRHKFTGEGFVDARKKYRDMYQDKSNKTADYANPDEFMRMVTEGQRLERKSRSSGPGMMGNDHLQKGSDAAKFAQRRPFYEDLHKNPGQRTRENPNAAGGFVGFYPVYILIAVMVAKIGYNIVVGAS